MAVIALAAAAALPALVDFHVLVRGHREGHDVLTKPGRSDLPRFAAGCAGEASRHIEAGSSVVERRCAACLARTLASVAPGVSVFARRLLALGRAPAPLGPFVDSLLASSQFSRGPPRA